MLALMAGCGGSFEREGQPGCCYYACESDHRDLFSAYFLGEGECRALAQTRCEEVDGDRPGLTDFAWRPESDLEPPDGQPEAELHDKCPVNRPDWYPGE